MGINLSGISFSCVDCSSRLNSAEDFETSWKNYSKDLAFDISVDNSDEFTVFRCTFNSKNVEKPGNFVLKQVIEELCVEETIDTSPEKKTADSSNLTSYRNKENFGGSEVMQTCPKRVRHKSFSRNYSEVSVNLVDSIRQLKDL